MSLIFPRSTLYYLFERGRWARLRSSSSRIAVAFVGGAICAVVLSRLPAHEASDTKPPAAVASKVAPPPAAPAVKPGSSDKTAANDTAASASVTDTAPNPDPPKTAQADPVPGPAPAPAPAQDTAAAAPTAPAPAPAANAAAAPAHPTPAESKTARTTDSGASVGQSQAATSEPAADTKPIAKGSNSSTDPHHVKSAARHARPRLARTIARHDQGRSDETAVGQAAPTRSPVANSGQSRSGDHNGGQGFSPWRDREARSTDDNGQSRNADRDDERDHGSWHDGQTRSADADNDRDDDARNGDRRADDGATRIRQGHSAVRSTQTRSGGGRSTQARTADRDRGSHGASGRIREAQSNDDGDDDAHGRVYRLPDGRRLIVRHVPDDEPTVYQRPRPGGLFGFLGGFGEE